MKPLLAQLNESLESPRFKLYLDMDGVFADFDEGVRRLTGSTPEWFKKNGKTEQMWKLIHSQTSIGTGFFANLPKMAGSDKLMEFVYKFKPQWLTATGKSNSDEVAEQKKLWLQDNFPPLVFNWVQTGSDKWTYVDNDVPSILIDDRMKAIGPWRKAGGLGILYKNADQAISELKDVLTEINSLEAV